MGWNKKIPPRRMPKTKSAAPPAPTKHTVPCDNFGVRRGGGGAPPPLWGPVPARASPRALHIPTLYGSEHVLVVLAKPLGDLSCVTTPRSAVLRQAAARGVDQVHPDAHSESMLGLPAPALTCARWCVHLQDTFPDKGFSQPQ